MDFLTDAHLLNERFVLGSQEPNLFRAEQLPHRDQCPVGRLVGYHRRLNGVDRFDASDIAKVFSESQGGREFRRDEAMDHLGKQFGRAFSELVFEFPFERASKSHEDFGGSNARNVDVEFVLVIP